MTNTDKYQLVKLGTCLHNGQKVTCYRVTDKEGISTFGYKIEDELILTTVTY